MVTALAGELTAAGGQRVASLAIPTLPPGRPGDPGLFGPDSQFWRVNRERAVTLGGPAAGGQTAGSLSTLIITVASTSPPRCSVSRSSGWTGEGPKSSCTLLKSSRLTRQPPL